MATNSSQEPICDELHILSESIVYKMIIALKWSTNLTAIVLLILHKVLKRKTLVFHPNTFAIYSFIYFCTISLASINVVSYGFEFLRCSLPFHSHCSRVWPVWLSFSLKSLYIFFSYGQDSGLIVLCAERCICIQKIASYEESSRPKLILAILILITIPISTIHCILSLVGIDFGGFSQALSIQRKDYAFIYQLILLYMFLMELLALCVFAFIRQWTLRYRKRIRPCALNRRWMSSPNGIVTPHLLSVKFQVEETLRVTGIFLPIVLTKFFLFEFSLLSITLSNALDVPASGITTQLIVYESESIGYYHPLVTALLFLYAHNQINFSKNRIYRSDSHGELGERAQIEHFKRLAELFEKDY